MRLDGPVILVGPELADGVIELDLAVSPERSFPGVVWRARDTDRYESFFVRPHQVGNPDAVQYTPVYNGTSSWQLYHGAGYWAPVDFPLGDWFTIRVVFAGSRAEIYVADLEEPGLVAELKLPPTAGRIGIHPGEPPIHVSGFRWGGPDEARFRAPAPPAVEPPTGLIEAWSVSTPFRESEAPAPGSLAWTTLAVEASGLANLARLYPVDDELNTVYARATVHSDAARSAALELGFSDRAVVSLNGRPLYAGSDGYRSRDYRFLGSIGWYDTVFLPLDAGVNELVLAVSEDFGGWGLQARFPDLTGLTL